MRERERDANQDIATDMEEIHITPTVLEMDFEDKSPSWLLKWQQK